MRLIAHYTHPDRGYDFDKEKAAKLLKEGERYEVRSIETGQYYTRIFIEGYGDFNSVLFDFYNEEDVDVPHDLIFKPKMMGTFDVNSGEVTVQYAAAKESDLISRADAITSVGEAIAEGASWYDAINDLPSASEPIVIRSKTLMPTNDFKEWAKRIRETNPNAVVIPCDAEVVSAEAVEEAEEPDEAHWMPLPGSYIEEDPT